MSQRKGKAKPKTEGHKPPPSPSAGASDAPKEAPGGRAARGAVFVFCVLAAVAAVTATWSVPRPIGDLYVALAAGRDILDGKLGQPDDWSFSTEGRVWVNQNWGTHLLCYGAHRMGGGDGLLVLKYVLVAGVALLVAKAARQRGAGWGVALLVGAGVVLAARSYIDLRPNLTQLVMMPALLCLLYSTRDRPRRAWLAGGLVALWSVMHGSFMLGLGMLVPAFLVAGLLNPFGIENITHPFIVARSEVWRTVSEWRSVFDAREGFGTVWEFAVVGGLLAGAVMVRLAVEAATGGKVTPRRMAERLGLVVMSLCLCSAAVVAAMGSHPDVQFSREMRALFDERRSGILAVALVVGLISLALAARFLVRRRREGTRVDWPAVSVWVFEAVLGGLTIFMAIKARRFIPTAMIVTAPMLAVELDWLIRRGEAVLRLGVLKPALAAAVLVPAVMLSAETAKYFSPNNPLIAPEPLFNRMHGSHANYGHELASFLASNDIGGRMFCEWRWEGYLQWRAPGMKPLIGGRAQQVYAEETFKEHARIGVGRLDLDTPAPPSAEITRRLLAKHDIHMVVVPKDQHAHLVASTLEAEDLTWAPIFHDGRNVVIVDGAHPDTRDLLDACARGELNYPDEFTEALSRGMCLAHPFLWKRMGPLAATSAREQLRRSIDILPTPAAYLALWGLVGRAGWTGEEFLSMLERDAERFAGSRPETYRGFRTLNALRSIHLIRATLLEGAGRKRQAAEAKAQSARITEELKATIALHQSER